MSVRFLRVLACTALGTSAVALAACQGNLGGGTGLSIPQAPGYNQPAGPGNTQSNSRERVLEGAVYLSSKLTEVPLPQLAGFGVAIELGSPGPIANPSPAASASSLSPRAAAAMRHLPGIASAAGAVPPQSSASPVPSVSPSSSISSISSTSPVAPSASVSPSSSISPSAAGAGSPAPGSSASASASAKPGHGPSPVAAATGAGPKIDTKTTVYPDDAPAAPTPVPTGEVQVFVKRVPLVRGYVQPQTDLSLYGLSAVRFTVPSSELLPKRGFTIAVYENGKHRHERLMAFDTDPTPSGSVIASSLTEPIVLKKGTGYLLMLYGDDTGATPVPVASGYPQPGNNPFPTPTGSGYPPGSYQQQQVPCQQPGYPQPGYPQQPNQNCTPTPFSPFGTPHP